jgi:hypothetical protein
MRFRLRTLLILTGIACVILATHGTWMRDAQRRIASKEKILAMTGGNVIVQHEDFGESNSISDGKYPAWLERAVGTEYLYPLNTFCLVQSAEPDPIINEAVKLPHLYLVKLPACQITDESVKPLTQLRSLVWLELFSTPITDDGVKAVSNIRSLEILDLRSTKVTDGCVPFIASLRRLRRLHTGGTAITPAGIKAIQQALPKCDIDQRAG